MATRTRSLSGLVTEGRELVLFGVKHVKMFLLLVFSTLAQINYDAIMTVIIKYGRSRTAHCTQENYKSKLNLN